MDGSALSEAAPRGVLARIVATWRDPRAGAGPEIEGAAEGRLLAYALVGSAIHLAGDLIEASLAPSLGAAADPTGFGAAALAGGLFVRPIGLYLVAGALHLACRAAGGDGTGRRTRAAVFWSGLAAEPIAFLCAIAAGLLLSSGFGLGAALASAFGALVWAALLAPALAEAQGFARAWPILAAFGGAALALSLVAAPG